MKHLGLLFLAVILISCNNSNKNYDAIGTFNATEVIVSSEIAGAILVFDVTEGGSLQEGKSFAIIDSTQLYLQKQQLLQSIEALEISRPSVDTQIAPLEKQLEKQKIEKQRIESLLKSNAAVGKQLDDIHSAIDVLEKQLLAQKSTLRKNVATIQAQVNALKIQVEQVNDRLSKCCILSPISGTILAKYAQAGELTSVGKPLLKIADMDNIYLKAYVLSSQLMDIKLGDDVTVCADFGGNNFRKYDGKITWISDESEFTPKNITTTDERANMVYAIKIAVQNDGYLKLGMYGNVKFN